MAIDFRPTELDTKCKEEKTYHMSIRHKRSNIVVAGTGDNRFALECSLLDKLRDRLKEREEDNARDRASRGAV